MPVILPDAPSVSAGWVTGTLSTPVAGSTLKFVRLREVALAAYKMVPAELSASTVVTVPPAAKGEPATGVKAPFAALTLKPANVVPLLPPVYTNWPSVLKAVENGDALPVLYGLPAAGVAALAEI